MTREILNEITRAEEYYRTMLEASHSDEDAYFMLVKRFGEKIARRVRKDYLLGLKIEMDAADRDAAEIAHLLNY